MDNRFDDAIKVFPDRLKNILSFIPDKVKSETYEIRVRKNKPLIINGIYGIGFVSQSSIVSYIDSSNGIIVSSTDMQHIMSAVCDYSIYTHQVDISNGFVTYGNGNRVGFCGTAVVSGGNIVSLSNISSMNIRIAGNFPDAADEILNRLFTNKMPKGIIISGAPCTGKTTILKSLACKLSSEYKYRFKKVVIIDERFEMKNSSGLNCDILSGYYKDEGIIHAIRTLSPDYIVCDEITDENESDRVLKGVNSGVGFILSIHAENKNELVQRKIFKKLASSGAFEYAVILKKSDTPCTIDEIMKIKDDFYENTGYHYDSVKFGTDSFYSYQKRKNAL